MSECDRCQVNRELRQDAEMYLAASEARVSALTAALEGLIGAFTMHRAATHKVQPMYCETCQEGTVALEQARNVLAAADRQPADGEG